MALYQHFCTSKNELFRLNTWLRTKCLLHEFQTNSKVKMFAPNPLKKRLAVKKLPPRKPYIEKKLGPRTNQLGIQMLSKEIYDQVFLEGYSDHSKDDVIASSKQELLKHKMNSEDIEMQPDVSCKIPPLKGRNIEEHFLNIGNEQVQDYKQLVTELLEGIPEPPKHWLMEEGWTRYVPGELPQKVHFPLEEAIIFDVEVCMKVGKIPTLATAVSNKAWYGWIGSNLITGTFVPNTSNQYNLHGFVPLESKDDEFGDSLNEHQLKSKVVIGHNVSYDRARIKEQYWLKRTGTRFIDTMSLHICVSGLTSYQRAIVKSSKFIDEDEEWKSNSSLNNIVDVYNLYCGGTITKETRNLFVNGSLEDIKENFQEVMKYCSGDVKVTYDILKVLYPLFLERFPHPITMAGMLELGTAYLPVNQNWNRYITDAEQSFEDLENEGKLLLARRADQACQLLYDEKYKEDLWLWDEDWEVKSLKMKNKLRKSERTEPQGINESSVNEEDEESDHLEEKFRGLWQTRDLLPKIKGVLPGYPNW